jgi:hypothetical protein
MAKTKHPVGPPEEYLVGPDAKIGLGRVIKWHDGISRISVELLDENGYHCVGYYSLGCWISPPPDVIAAAMKTASLPPIATYRTGQAGPGRSGRQRARRRASAKRDGI